RGINSVPLDPELMWAPVFHGFDMNQEISFTATIDDRHEVMTLKFNPKYISPVLVQPSAINGGMRTIKTDQSPPPTFALDIEYRAEGRPNQATHLVIGTNSIRIDIDYLEATKYIGGIIGLRMHESPNETATRFGQLDIVGKQGDILKFLQLIEPKLESLSVIATGDISMVYGDIGLPRKLPVAYMGDGISRLLEIITHIGTAQNGFVLIDEVESGIHYSVLPKVWEAIAAAACAFNCQVIGTTHSYECLQAAREGLAGKYEEDFSYIRLDRKDDTVTAKRFDYGLLQTALDTNMEVR